ncbi:MAG: ABC transporter ATP-binding protein [Deltaproteobacteria bacterium]|nr:ABC transporter ATP-binding protein [Deltaproteobacteria bacterium]
MPEGRGLELSLEAVSKEYVLGGRTIPVLNEAVATIEAGEVVAVVGKSGSGKSTLLQLLGLLDQPTGGRILYDGRDLRSQRPDVIEDFRNRYVGFVFQFHHLLPEFTATENVMMPALIAGWSMGDARTRAISLLERVGLGPRLDHAPGELSGGEQQRVALARALSLSPSLVLADEPTGNLDPRTASDIHELLIELNQEIGTTLLVATHNMALARMLPRTLTLQDGGLVPWTEEEGA